MLYRWLKQLVDGERDPARYPPQQAAWTATWQLRGSRWMEPACCRELGLEQQQMQRALLEAEARIRVVHSCPSHAAPTSPSRPWASASRHEARSFRPTGEKSVLDIVKFVIHSPNQQFFSGCREQRASDHHINEMKKTLTFNSLIFSWRPEFESFNFWASPRNWFTIRTASIKMAALSVLGGLPGSNMEPNSTNLWESR